MALVLVVKWASYFLLKEPFEADSSNSALSFILPVAVSSSLDFSNPLAGSCPRRPAIAPHLAF